MVSNERASETRAERAAADYFLRLRSAGVSLEGAEAAATGQIIWNPQDRRLVAALLAHAMGVADHRDVLDVYGWSNEITAPRDAAWGLPTGMRQHKPYTQTSKNSLDESGFSTERLAAAVRRAGLTALGARRCASGEQVTAAADRTQLAEVIQAAAPSHWPTPSKRIDKASPLLFNFVALLVALGVLLGTSAKASAQVTAAEYHGPGDYAYNVEFMTDLDQRRGGLPSSGVMYCGPTTAMNTFSFAANFGFPEVQPGPGLWEGGARPPLHFFAHRHAGQFHGHGGWRRSRHQRLGGRRHGPARLQERC